jgi:hypothetical protein
MSTLCAVAVLSCVSVRAEAALDCARVKTLHDQGKRASDIARELDITTPEVQGCLAGEIEESAPAGGGTGLPLSRQLPAGDAPVRRPPNQ